MKRFKHRMSGLLMALGLAAVSPSVADEVVATAAGGWFAVDSRAVKDTTLAGGVIVGGVTNVVLQSSPDAWGEAGGGASATITCESAAGSGMIAEATTAGEVEWMPAARSGVNTLTYTSGSVQKTAQFLTADQVGDAAWARVKDGVCTVFGTGDMWSYGAAGASPLRGYNAAITNLVVEPGVTSVGSRFFENMWYLQDVALGADVTNVAARAFKKCYGLTNVTSSATGALALGDYAFLGCHSLQAMTFAGTASFGTECYSLQTAIYMRDGIPEVYPIPAVTMGGKGGRLLATNDLQDEGSWVDVTDKTPEERKAYHFFKIKVVMP